MFFMARKLILSKKGLHSRETLIYVVGEVFLELRKIYNPLRRIPLETWRSHSFP
jgi:hypothetical protein